MTVPHVVAPVMQRTSHSCGVAALAMLLGKPIEVVMPVALTVRPKLHTRGMWLKDLIATAAALGVKLRRRHPRELNEDSVAVLFMRPKAGAAGHFVLSFQGVIVDPATGLVWDDDAFRQASKMRPFSALEVA